MTTYPIRLSSLGGSGENGRNCHLIEDDQGIILLDCGVKREIVGDTVGFYPALTPEIVRRIRAVFVTHTHEDHVASLPLLYHLGYEGKVYAMPETAVQVPKFMRKWRNFALENGGTLPYEEEDLEKVRFGEIELGEQRVEGIKVTAGRSAHVLGGVWYVFELGGRKIFYTGDICLESPSLELDLPPACDAAIMNGAYAGQQMKQEEQFQKLLREAEKTLARGGKLMLPVPSKGRGIDIALYLDRHLEKRRIYLEDAVFKSMQSLAEEKAWIRAGYRPELSSKVKLLRTDEERRKALADSEPAVYITPDGMITTPLSLAYLEALKQKPENKIIITGHAAQGTAGAGILYDEAWRKKHGVKAESGRIVIKVHLDDDDIFTLCRKSEVKKLILFHSDASCTEKIKARLKEDGREAKTLVWPEALTV